ncbi:armadillo-type protein [Syncephalis plumigaleata]|nr:armadillo-type protein [Syncephalis plumigaleata]
MDSSRHYNLRNTNNRQRRQQAYKHTSVPRTTSELHAKHRARDQEIRKEQREQLILGKRFRHRRLSTELNDEDIDFNVDSADTELLEQQLQRVKRLSKLLTEPSKAIQQYVVEGDAVTQLTEFLTSTDAEEQLQALWCITNIAAGSKLQCQKLRETVPYLIGFLRHNNEAIQNQAVWALGNLALEGPVARRLLRENGIIIPLVDLLAHGQNNELIKTVCFTISSMLHGDDTRVEQYIQAGLLDHLKRHLNEDHDVDLLSELCWILTYLTHGDDSDAINGLLLRQGFASIMVDHLGQLKEQGALVLPLIRAIANILAGPDEYADSFMSVQHFFLVYETVLNQLGRLVPVRKETLWLLSNLTAGMDKHAHQIIDTGILDRICQLFAEVDFDLRKEASYVILNIAHRGRVFFDCIPLSSILPGYVDFLHSHDMTLLQMALSFIQIILDDYPQGRQLLKQAGVPDALDSATLNQQSELHQMAGHLLDEIFEENALTPANNSNIASLSPVSLINII